MIDTLLLIFKLSKVRLNPFLSQYNTLKYALLVYRISWLIQERNMYSLATKCQEINKYINKSIQLFLSY